jgi:uncharacterized phage protein gp47/JayE
MIVYYQKQMAGTANKDKITNFNDGSVARILLDTIAMDSYKLWFMLDQASRNCFASTAKNEFLVLIGEEHGIQRESATVSHGVVNATRASDLNKDQDINIPAGTQLMAKDSKLIFTTDVDLLIPKNDVGAMAVAATSVKPGMANNIKNGTVLVPMDSKSDVNYIVGESFHDGKDIETDEALRTRIRSATYLKVGTESFYKQKPLILPDVRAVNVADNEENKSVTITVYPGSQAAAVNELLLEPENKVAGTTITVVGGDTQEVNIDMHFTVKDNAKQDDVGNAIKTNVMEVFNKLKPHIGDYTNESTLYLENLHKAISTTDHLEDYKLNEPINTVTCTSGKLIVLGEWTFS